MRDIHLHAAILNRLRIVHEQNEALRTHWNLRPLQLRRYRHGTSLHRVFIGDDATVFPRGRCHEKWRCATAASSATSSLTGAATATILSHHRTTQRNQSD